MGFALVWGGRWWLGSVIGIGALYTSVRGASRLRAISVGLVSGAAVFGISSEWSRLFGAHAYLSLVAALSLFWVACVVVASFARSEVQSLLLGPSAIVLAELFRTRFPLGGYGLATVSNTQIDGPLSRAAVVVGSAGVSGLAAALGIAVVTLLTKALSSGFSRIKGRSKGFVSSVVVSLGCVIIALGPLFFPESKVGSRGSVEELNDNSSSRKLRVAVVQVYDENRPLSDDEEARGALLTWLKTETEKSAVARPELVVWPEASLGSHLLEGESMAARAVREATSKTGASLIANGQPLGGSLDRFVNRNYFFSYTGRLEMVSDKEKLVPFGEYVPWRTALQPRIRSLERIPIDGEPGQWRLFRLGEIGIGSVICFESTFSYYIRERVRAGSEIIVVETNNRSFETSSLSRQHVSASRMRAIETRRFVVHAALSGISAVIRPDGSILESAGLFERKVLLADVEPSGALTPYVRFGDWAPGGLAAASMILGLGARKRLRPEAKL